MRLDGGLYDPILLKGGILLQGYNQNIGNHSKLVSKAYCSNLSSNEGQMSHDLQPRDYMYMIIKKNIT